MKLRVWIAIAALASGAATAGTAEARASSKPVHHKRAQDTVVVYRGVLPEVVSYSSEHPKVSSAPARSSDQVYTQAATADEPPDHLGPYYYGEPYGPYDYWPYDYDYGYGYPFYPYYLPLAFFDDFGHGHFDGFHRHGFHGGSFHGDHVAFRTGTGGFRHTAGGFHGRPGGGFHGVIGGGFHGVPGGGIHGLPGGGIHVAMGGGRH